MIEATRARVVCSLLLLLVAAPAHAQRTYTASAGAHYDISPATRVFLGRNWRTLWATPVTVPVADLGAHGGLTPMRTGGRQSQTLHFQGGDGRRYIFRSIDKYLHREALPPALRRTPLGNLVQDQISALFPAPGLMIAPLQEAVGLLHAWSTPLVVLPDDPRLGEFREQFAGMMGQLEENPNEGEDDSPGFAGSRKIVGADKYLENLDESPKHRLVAAEYLKARLVDFLVGDTDRGGDNWKFARFPQGDGYSWRPVPRDRDFAFMAPDGPLNMIAKRVYPKILSYDASYESMRTLTFMSRDMDRRLLVEIPRAQWDSIVRHVQSQWTDEVLRVAVGSMPSEYQPHAAARLFAALRARRDQLHSPAGEFYAIVATEADVHATAEAETAEVERFADGSVEVRLYGGPAAAIAADSDAQPAPADGRTPVAPYFQRRFLPQETREIRLYLHAGDDRVLIRGAAPRSILVRVIGGDGDDILRDVSSVERGTATIFYTADGVDDVQPAPHTRIDRRAYRQLIAGRPEDMKRDARADSVIAEAADSAAAVRQTEDARVTNKLMGLSDRDWGSRAGIGPRFDHRTGPGILFGAGYSSTQYGFRREPYATHVGIDVLYAPEANGFGVELGADRRFENSPLGISLFAHATQFETFRFFGYGNDAPFDAENVRVRRDEISVRPALSWLLPTVQLTAGPVLRVGSPRFDENSPLGLERPLGTGRFSQAGAFAEARIERGATKQALRRGMILDVGGSVYPALLDVPQAYGEAHALARTYIGIPGPGSPFLALRAGAQQVLGDFPVHDAALLGGRHSLRGFVTDRFAGDALLHGGVELHAPLATVTLLVRGQLGAFALADAGRVYFDGASPGGWHTATGGGLWFATLGKAVSLTYAYGETGRFYLSMGLPF